jgi:acetyl-CoA C-acetyltransferase
MSELQQDVFIVSGARTAVGDFGGSLKDVAPAELGRIVIAEAIKRSGLKAEEFQHVVMGQVIQSNPADMYLARVAAINAGLPTSSAALTLNRLCGSGIQSIVSAAQMIRLGECDFAIAGGAESMSRAPYVNTSLRWGARLGDSAMVDALLTALHDPFGNGHMGITAENVAQRYKITREEQDAVAMESHVRAARAVAEGRFKTQIVPVEIKTRQGVITVDTDEHPRGDTNMADLAKLKPAFQRENGTVTAGNASGLNDGAAAVTLLSGVVAWGHAGVDPAVMGLGPIKAVPIALQRAGLSISDMDVIESNEAFAVQACAVARDLDFPADRTNPNGSGISIGHPVGATGSIMTVRALYELERINGRYGLMTMCIGGGQGIALIIERLKH